MAKDTEHILFHAEVVRVNLDKLIIYSPAGHLQPKLSFFAAGENESESPELRVI